jgi:glycerol-3-phosphate dehydrogenase
VSFPVELPPPVRSQLLHLYGSLAGEVLAPAREDPSLLEPLDPEAPELAAQALYAATHEWARTADDVLRRRTTLALRGRATAEAAALVEELLAVRPRT